MKTEAEDRYPKSTKVGEFEAPAHWITVAEWAPDLGMESYEVGIRDKDIHRNFTLLQGDWGRTSDGAFMVGKACSVLLANGWTVENLRRVFS